MDNKNIYGTRFHTLTFKAAIHSKPPIICDYRILTVAISDKRIADLVRDNRYLELKGSRLKEQEAQALAAGIALRRAYSKYGVKHAISFHRSIKAAEQFGEQQQALGRIDKQLKRVRTFHVSSRTTAGDRARELIDYENSRYGLITNARCLQEGVDIPAVDCVLFADPKQSVVDIVQAAGRALRPFKGKRYGHIVVPIIVPHGKDFDDFAETTEFKQIARTISALSTQDDRIAEEFRAIDRGKPRTGRIVEIAGDFPVGLKIDPSDFIDKVHARIWDHVGRANWREFDAARKWARSLKLRSVAEWLRLCREGKLPADIPKTPDQVYADKGWVGFGDWLGTGTIAPSQRKYRAFRAARTWARSLKLKSVSEWWQFTKSGKLPADIPKTPDQVYADKGWVGFGDWLGTGTIAPSQRKYRAFRAARTWARSLKLKSGSKWRQFTKSGKLPADIPKTPDQVYADKGWVGFGDWLGTGTIAPSQRKYRAFRAARTWARSLKLKSVSEWWQFTKSGKLPADIPKTPDQVYADKGWVGFGDWLGTGTIAPSQRKYRAFRAARTWARSLKLKSGSKWRQFTKSGKLPADIPKTPNQVYADKGWVGFGDWLGTGRMRRVKGNRA